MKKRTYRAVPIKDVVGGELGRQLNGERVAVGIDVAKEIFFATVMLEREKQVAVTVKWRHPEETVEFVGWVRGLREAGARLDVAMEPSGTYGDIVRVLLLGEGLEVFRVSPKRSHDAAEVYDGVPSWHDAKSAAIVAMLHLDGRSEAWPLPSERERSLKAAVYVLEVHEKQFQSNRNRLESLLARHWPEVTRHLDLDSATLLEVLSRYGGPRAVAADAAAAEALMVRVGRRFLRGEKVAQVLASARTTVGVEQVEEERRMVMAIAAEARRNQQASRQAQAHVEQLAEEEPVTKAMAPVVGRTTAAVLVAALGDPQRYACATAYQKSAGLNLKVKSSGKQKGELHITKRGPGVVRLFLYLAALRLIRTDEVARAWYARKVERDGGKRKMLGVVAVMRKLVRALWHVARGQPFDAHRLFDVRRLNLCGAQGWGQSTDRAEDFTMIV